VLLKTTLTALAEPTVLEDDHSERSDIECAQRQAGGSNSLYSSDRSTAEEQYESQGESLDSPDTQQTSVASSEAGYGLEPPTSMIPILTEMVPIQTCHLSEEERAVYFRYPFVLRRSLVNTGQTNVRVQRRRL